MNEGLNDRPVDYEFFRLFGSGIASTIWGAIDRLCSYIEQPVNLCYGLLWFKVLCMC